MLRAATLMLLACLAGCATVSRPLGRDYAQAALQNFVLNETSVDQAEAALGPPASQGTMRGIAKPAATIIASGAALDITTLKYVYAPNGAGMPPPLHPFKSATLVFVAGRLIAYAINNNIPGEVYPPVDEGRLKELHQGQTTRSEAIAMFGPPAGQFVNVFGADAGTTTVEYGWSQAQAGTVTLRSLQILFDRRDRMSSYAVFDNSFPAGQVPLLAPGPQTPPAMPMPHHTMPHPDLEHT